LEGGDATRESVEYPEEMEETTPEIKVPESLPKSIPVPLVPAKSMNHHKMDRTRCPHINTSHMNMGQAIDMARWVIGILVTGTFVFISVFIFTVQGIFICCVNKAKYHQESLERHFMAQSSA
jgi:hypothetical protein